MLCVRHASGKDKILNHLRERYGNEHKYHHHDARRKELLHAAHHTTEGEQRNDSATDSDRAIYRRSASTRTQRGEHADKEHSSRAYNKRHTVAKEHLHKACNTHNGEEALRVKELLSGATLRHKDTCRHHRNGKDEPLQCIDYGCSQRKFVVNIILQFHTFYSFKVIIYSLFNPNLILHLILLIAPLTEGGKRLVTHKVFAANRPQVVVKAQLVVYERVVEVYRRSIALGIGIAYSLDTRPIERTEAHRARLARGVDRTTRKVKGAQLTTGVAYRHHLGVCRRVVVWHHTIGASAKEFTIAHDDSSKGTSTLIDILRREVNSHLHKLSILLTKGGCFGQSVLPVGDVVHSRTTLSYTFE